MDGRFIIRILLVIVVIAVLIGIGVSVYNAGVAQGLAKSGKLVPPSGTAPYPYYGPFFYRPFGFGFGFLGLLFPLLLILLFFGLLRGIFWGGWRGRGWGGPRGNWQDGAPPIFEEWHRRAHEMQSQSQPENK